MKYKVTINYKIFMFDSSSDAIDFAFVAKKTMVPDQYDNGVHVTIELLTDEELREEEE